MGTDLGRPRYTAIINPKVSFYFGCVLLNSYLGVALLYKSISTCHLLSLSGKAEHDNTQCKTESVNRQRGTERNPKLEITCTDYCAFK